MLKVFANKSDLSINTVLEWFRFYDFQFIRTDNPKRIKDGDILWLRKSPRQIESKYQFIFEMVDISKEEVLRMASKFNIKTPIVFKYKTREQLYKNIRQQTIIAKPKHEVTQIQPNEKEKYVDYTTLLNEKNYNNYGLNSTLFQEYINPEFEIRTTYFDDKFYSCAIIKKDTFLTEIVDIRYHRSLDNVIYEKIFLEKQIKDKLRSLFNFIGVEFGCIDLLYKDNKYFLLEINQIGQFEEHSVMSGNNFERLLAKHIIKKYEKKRKILSKK